MTDAFIGLGANLGDPVRTLQSAVQSLCALPSTTLVAVSSAWRSAPLGPPGQPDYVNAVARLRSGLTPHGLLAALQAVERAHGRERGIRWGARTLDLDLLLFGDDVITTQDLVVPHPELARRNFVVVPLLELAPDLVLPDGRALAELAAA
ncbi:MAG: 2-amino-4-hydroxy-6-hydroxymethyldihydropteridine diphosphokinase, partial [Moraxellaceae bacterium]